MNGRVARWIRQAVFGDRATKSEGRKYLKHRKTGQVVLDPNHDPSATRRA